MTWRPIKGTKGKGRYKRVKVGKRTFEIGERKVKNKWVRMYTTPIK